MKIFVSQVLALLFPLITQISTNPQSVTDGQDPYSDRNRPDDKLLVVVIDGFRWDYISRFTRRSRQGFPGFEEFIRGGVQSEYLKSVFPAESFPSWQTISTGLYPENHGILANQFYDTTARGHKQSKFFNHIDERMTGDVRWWHDPEPIWATAQKQGKDFVTFLWSRCDVEWDDVNPITPRVCENVYHKDNSKTLHINLDMALMEFQTGRSAALIYEDSLGKAAEAFGPLSKNVEMRLRALDKSIQNFLVRLREVRMDQIVNVVIMSDHGMTYGSNPIPIHHPPSFPFNTIEVRQIQMSYILKSVQRIVKMTVGSGAYMQIYPKQERFIPEIIEALRAELDGKGVDIFTRDEIPDHLHWRDNVNTPPILILARPGVILLRAGGNLQRPASSLQLYGGGYDPARITEQTQQGVSGYDPEETDMRGVFMARGPGFHSDGHTYAPIELVDVYQMFCFLLNIDPQTNDGVWDRIRALLRNSSAPINANWSILLAALWILFKM